jgi:endonuclease III related protein
MNYRDLLERLLAHYGPQQWWPADSPFEVMVGAILTQNTQWRNVELALQRLQQETPLTPEAIIALDRQRLAEALRPSGYYNIKAGRLVNFCHWLIAAGGVAALAERETAELRTALLAIHGIGAETADDILLYACQRPIFVVDSYSRRLFGRLGLIEANERYEVIRQQVEMAWQEDAIAAVADYNELHALIVQHGKNHCRPRPYCQECPISKECGRKGVV